MSEIRKYNYYFSEFGFVSNDEVTIYKLKNKKIAVQDIFDIEIVVYKSSFFKINSLLFSNIFFSFYCLSIVASYFFILKKVNKKKNIIKVQMTNGVVYKIYVEDKFIRKATLFKKRIFEYKLFREVENLGNK